MTPASTPMHQMNSYMPPHPQHNQYIIPTPTPMTHQHVTPSPHISYNGSQNTPMIQVPFHSQAASSTPNVVSSQPQYAYGTQPVYHHGRQAKSSDEQSTTPILLLSTSRMNLIIYSHHKFHMNYVILKML